MKNTSYKLVIYVPQTHIEQIRIALAGIGAGRIGNYDNCAFITHGIGVFRPLKGSKPHSGLIHRISREGEAKIEVTIEEKLLKKAVSAIKKIHPYETPAIDIYKLNN